MARFKIDMAKWKVTRFDGFIVKLQILMLKA